MNRFTHIFDNPPGYIRSGEFYIALADTLEIECNLPEGFSLDILKNTPNLYDKEWAEWKLTFISFLSHMTDKELDEILGELE